jgi:hypothetical protein
MTLNTSLKNALRAGVVAVALVGASLAGAAPAQAQVGFQLNFGDFRAGPPSGHGPNVTLRFGSPDYFRYCMDDRQIFRSLRNAGYRDVNIVRSQNSTNRVLATARKKNHWYQLRVDRCTGRVDRITQIDKFRKPNGNFNLTFSF